MCGIVGYVGNEDCLDTLVSGLRSLEYRGYDSAGVAIVNGNGLTVVKEQGNLDQLENALKATKIKGNIGIGHTRWATHGIPSQINAHPHTCCNKNIAVVHNGIIENYAQLRLSLESKGHVFLSQTDTEVIAHLIEDHYQDDLKKAVQSAIAYLTGAFALAVMTNDDTTTIVAAKKESPLVLGIGKNENYVASDIPALLGKTREMILLEDGEIAVLTAGNYEVSDFKGNKVAKEITHIHWDQEAAEKGGFEDFMLKEIFEQPKAVKETLRGMIDETGVVKLKELKISPVELSKVKRIIIVACGTSYHAGMVAKHAIETWANLPVSLEVASEFRYGNLLVDSDTLVVAITQSGETADTLAGVKSAKEKGAKILGVTNVLGSNITRVADALIYTHAGPEIGVAATKTFTSQLAALTIFALYMAQLKEKISTDKVKELSNKLMCLPKKIDQILENANAIEEVAKKYKNKPDFLFLGRGLGAAVAFEGALKLKEISYIHAEGCAAGEMKHGPIALIDEDCPVLMVAAANPTIDKIRSNVEEVRARGAKVIVLINEGDSSFNKIADDFLKVPKVNYLISPIIDVIPLQLFAYYIAKNKGCNVDQPRNLAKSVTVE